MGSNSPTTCPSRDSHPTSSTDRGQPHTCTRQLGLQLASSNCSSTAGGRLFDTMFSHCGGRLHAQEILVADNNSTIPRRRSTEKSRRYRSWVSDTPTSVSPHGAGLYDSNEVGPGRLYHRPHDGHAYATSPDADGWCSPATQRPEAMQNVLRMHRGEVAKIDESGSSELLSLRRKVGQRRRARERHGPQLTASVLAQRGRSVSSWTATPPE